MQSFTPSSETDRFVLVTEVGARDGFQSEARFVPTEVKADVVREPVGAAIR